jgi:nucleoid DNA-binding protein
MSARRLTHAVDRSGHTVVNFLIFLFDQRYLSKIVSIFFDQMATAIKNGDRVEIRGLCSFYVREYEDILGRIQKPGRSIKH